MVKLHEHLTHVHQVARESLKQAQGRQKAHYDQGHSNDILTLMTRPWSYSWIIIVGYWPNGKGHLKWYAMCAP